MESLLHGVNRFQKRVYPKHKDLFRKLALAQRPKALFITCADSRIDPCLLTQTMPGELFVCRVIGNIVPPYPKTIGGVSATIEYAVGVLHVPDVIVCAHTDCGVIKAILNRQALQSLPNVTAWLRHARAARRAAGKSGGRLAGRKLLLALTERNAVEQLKNLRTHPAVVTRLRQGNVRLHAWVYHIGTGVVAAYDPARNRFSQIRTPRSRERKSREVDLRQKTI